MAALLGSAAIAAEKHLATTFQQFSDNLYCSGSEERLCGTGGPRTGPGECLWFAGTRPVKPAEMDPVDNGARAAWPRHRWDPVAAGAVPASEFTTDMRTVQQCFRGKRVHFAGDSTTRDAYTMLIAELKLAELKPSAPRMARQRETLTAPDGTQISQPLTLTLTLTLTLSLSLSLSLTLSSWAHSMMQSRAFSVPWDEEGGATRWALVPRRAHSSGGHSYSVAAIALAGGVERLWEGCERL